MSDELRDRLAEALHEAWTRMPAGIDGLHGRDAWRYLADALLPVVAEQMAETRRAMYESGELWDAAQARIDAAEARHAALVAAVEALAGEFADDEGVEGYINLGEVEDRLRAVLAEHGRQA